MIAMLRKGNCSDKIINLTNNQYTNNDKVQYLVIQYISNF